MYDMLIPKNSTYKHKLRFMTNFPEDNGKRLPHNKYGFN